MNQIDPTIEEPVACPYVGLADGARPTSAVGDAANRCHAGSESAAIDLSFQEEYCFSNRYPTCDRYRPLLEVEAVAARPGLSVQAALAAEEEALAEASSGMSDSDDAQDMEPVDSDIRPAARVGPRTSSGLVGVFATPDPTAGSATTSPNLPTDLPPDSRELLGTQPFAMAPSTGHRTPTPPPTAWRSETTASVLASILPPFTLLSAPRDEADPAPRREIYVTSAPTTTMETPSVIEAGPPRAAIAIAEAPTADITADTMKASTLPPTQPRPADADPHPVATTAAVATIPPEAATSIGQDAPAEVPTDDDLSPVGHTSSGDPRPAPAAMAPAVAVTVGPWPKESISQPDYIRTRGSDSARSSRRRRGVFVVLGLVVAVAAIALFFAAASGSLDRWLPSSFVPGTIVVSAATVLRLPRI